jgi:preprotein translocase subunit SecE
VARDRQRAKQRKARRQQQRGPVRPSQPRRADLPGELEHASGEVDEFEAALVAGADGQTVDDEPDVRDEVDAAEDVDVRDEARAEDLDDDRSALDADRSAEDDRSALTGSAVADDEPSALVSRPGDEDELDEDSPEELDDEAFDELEDEVDDATLEREAVRTAPARREAAPGAPTRKGAGRFGGFLRASWAELQRVQWPDRRQVAQATGVVIGFVIVAGLYLGVADWVAKQIVNAII